MKLTDKQLEAQKIFASLCVYIMLFGGSRSGKTFLIIRNIVTRALKAKGSRHCILRFRFNHIKSSIIFDTFPRVMTICYPDVEYKLNKTDWFVTFHNGSEIWFGGLDDKQRTEKILGNEYVTIYLNECSQISWASVGMVITRLAQQIFHSIDGVESTPLKPKMYFDCNPPTKLHWTYLLFVKKIDPETKKPILKPDNYDSLKMNPEDNIENLSADYLETLDGLSERLKKRFKKGEFAEGNPDALFNDETIDRNRILDASEVPQLIRIVVSVDPSGSDDKDNAGNDPIGIVVLGLGIDGVIYLLEDCTVLAGPKIWGDIATTAFDRWKADCVVAEVNYGGAMVKFVIYSCRPHTPFQPVTASRGKHVRAEPIAVLYEQNKVKHVGYYPELEEELAGFNTFGYTGAKSPNRADALVWGCVALFPGATRKKDETVNNVIQSKLNHYNKR